MSVDILMPALSPTMEEGTLSKWLVKEGDKVESGDLIADLRRPLASLLDHGETTFKPGQCAYQLA